MGFLGFTVINFFFIFYSGWTLVTLSLIGWKLPEVSDIFISMYAHGYANSSFHKIRKYILNQSSSAVCLVIALKKCS